MNEILILGFDNLRDTSFQEKNKTFILAANNHKIGCGYAISMKDNVQEHFLLCLMNRNKYENIEIYRDGVKCSNCYDWSEECNEIHTGLCGASQIIEYRLVKGPVGERGERGLPGSKPDDFKSDSLYWSLYFVLFLGVAGNFYLHFCKIRGLAPFNISVSIVGKFLFQINNFLHFSSTQINVIINTYYLKLNNIFFKLYNIHIYIVHAYSKGKLCHH